MLLFMQSLHILPVAARISPLLLLFPPTSRDLVGWLTGCSKLSQLQLLERRMMGEIEREQITMLQKPAWTMWAEYQSTRPLKGQDKIKKKKKQKVGKNHYLLQIWITNRPWWTRMRWFLPITTTSVIVNTKLPASYFRFIYISNYCDLI